MTENKKEPTFELQSWFDGGDIFFRPKDKKRLAEAVDAIVEKDLGVAIIGSNEVVLDHYGRMLVARMRKVERFQLDVFVPVTTDSVLTRFNKMLAEISLEQAAKPPLDGQAVRLLVINDARVVNEDQWGLLVRLLADFPGVNARLVLVINKSGWPAHEKLLHSLGKKMHRWVVNVPATDEARLLMDAAEDGGIEAETHALLIDVGLGTLVASRQRSNLEQQELDPDLPELPELDVDVLLGSPDADELDSGELEEKDARGGFLWRNTMIVFISLALSAVALLWLYEDQSVSQRTSESLMASQSKGPVEGSPTKSSPTKSSPSKSSPIKSYTIEAIAVPTAEQIETKRLKAKRNLALATVRQEDVAADSREADSSVTESVVTEIEPDELAADEVLSEEVFSEELLREEVVVGEAVVGELLDGELLVGELRVEELLDSELSDEGILAEELLLDEASDQQPTPVLLIPQATQVTFVAPVVPEPKPEPVLTALQKAVKKVASASPDAYFVQHTVLSSELTANGYVRRYPVLSQALVVPVSLRQATVYSVVSGPFSSRSTAALFTQNKAIPNDYWIRNAVQLQAVLRR
jgi:hypothetical protein